MIEVTSAGGVSPTPPPDNAARSLIQSATTALSQSTDKASVLAGIGAAIGHLATPPPQLTPDEVREVAAGVTQWICHQLDTDDAKAGDLTGLVQGLATSLFAISDSQMTDILHSIAESVPTDSKKGIGGQLLDTYVKVRTAGGDPTMATALGNLSSYLLQ